METGLKSEVAWEMCFVVNFVDDSGTNSQMINFQQRNLVNHARTMYSGELKTRLSKQVSTWIEQY